MIGRTGVWMAMAALFAVTVVRNVYLSGIHPDDWRAMSDTMVYPLVNSGRWLAHLLTNHVNAYLDILPVQLLVAFLALAVTAHLLARHAVGPAHIRSAALLIFAGGVTHVYFGEIIHFDEFVAANTLCLLGAVWAFTTVGPGPGSWPARLGAVQVLALILAVYPSFVLLGTLGAILALMRVDRYGLAAAVRIIVGSLVLLVLGVGLYLLEQEIAHRLMTDSPAMRRFQFADAPTFLGKLAWMPGILREIHTTSLAGADRGYRMVFLALAAAVLATGLLAALAAARTADGPGAAGVAAGRVLVGLVTVLGVMPSAFWLAFDDPFLPARSLGFYGFALMAMLACCGHLIALRTGRIGAVRAGLLAVSAALVVTGALASARLAGVRGQAAERDRVMARDIARRIAGTPGFDGRIVNAVGGITYPDLAWGRFVPASTFGPDNEFNAALDPHLALDRWVAHLPAGPRACPAFPADGSVFTAGGIAYVCLQPQEHGWTRAACAPLPGIDGRACFGPRYVAFFLPECTVSLGGIGLVDLTFRDRDGQTLLTTEARADTLGRTRVANGCAFFAPDAPPAFHTVELAGTAIDTTPLWHQTLTADHLEPWTD